MSGLDETDMQILQLLLADGRRSFADIGDAVELSGPAVSNRVDRLREAGVIEGFTAIIDRSTLETGPELVITLAVQPGETASVFDALRSADGVHRTYRTVDARIIVHVVPPSEDVEAWLAEFLDLDVVESYEVRSLVEVETVNQYAGTAFALSCAQCGNSVTDEGVTERLGDRRYHFCCPSCAEKFRERYETLTETEA